MTEIEASILIPQRRRSIPWRNVREQMIRGGIIACGAVTIACTALIVVVLLWNAIKFFSIADTSPWQFLTGTKWAPLMGAKPVFGVLPLVMGTMLVAVVAMFVALPLGLLAAIWLSDMLGTQEIE